MKKILSLFCALVVVLSASAVQLTPAMVAPAKKAEFVSLSKTDKAVVAKKAAAQMAVAQRNGKVLNKSAKAPMMLHSAATKAHKAPKATAETIDLKFDNSGDPSFEYYAADGDWYIGWPDVTKKYIVRFDYLVGFEGKFGSYTIADLDLDYSFMSDYTSGARKDLMYTDAAFTVKDEGNNAWSLSGYVVCENGNTYNLSGYYEMLEGETYDVELTDLTSAEYYSVDNDWYFTVANSEYSFTLDLVSETGMFAGEYITEDAILNYCEISTPYAEDPESVKELEISIVTKETAAPGELPTAYELTGAILSNKGNTYNIHLVVTAPLEPKRVVNANVECVDFEWPNCDYPGVAGMFIFTDTDVPTRAFQVAVADPVGEFTRGNGIVREYTGMVDYSTLMPYMIDNGSVSVSFNVEKMVLVVKAEMVCTDTIQYNFTSEIPVELAGVKTLSFDNLSIDDSWASWFGVYFFDAENEEAAISGDFAAPSLDDYEFASNEIECTVYTEEAGEVYSLIMTYAHIYNDGKNLDITFIGEDMVLYTVNAKFTIPEPVDNVEISLGDLELNDLRANMGAWQLSGYAPDSSIWVSVVIGSKELEGSYTMDDVAAFLDYNEFAIMEEGELIDEAPLYELYKNIVVTAEPIDGSKEVKLHVEIEGHYGTHNAKLHLTSAPVDPDAKEGDEYDMQEDIEAEYAAEDITEFEVDGEEGYAYVRVTKDDELFAMLIYVDEGATELAAGTYEINDTYEPGSVQPGEISGSSVYPTFWGTLTEEGKINVPLFFLVEGTVEVSYDEAGELQLVVEATNTWGNTASIRVNAPKPQGVENVNAAVKAMKMVKNGNLVIKKNGVEYNVLGAQL